MQATSASKRTMAGLGDLVTSNGQGFLVAAVVAVAAQFLSDHYGAPAMLMALLLGIAFHFLSEEGACKPGIDFTARTVLRFGVALLGARISVELIVGLGPQLIFVVIAAVILTLLFGLAAARLLGRGWRFGLLTGGSVAICGASAAMAISAVLPKNEHSERNLIFTVLSVTVLSTVAMIAYPILTDTFAFNDEVSGVFLGGTIHDVTAELHPSLASAAVTAARALDMPCVGLDFIVRQADQPGYIFIEANERAGLANHEPQPTAERFIDLLFPYSNRQETIA